MNANASNSARTAERFSRLPHGSSSAHSSNVIDYLILGGGSAGCVLAARLSEDAGKTVCLVEAGRNISRTDMPEAVRSRYPGRAYLDTANIWQRLKARMSASAATRRYEQARLLGGGSAINALMANRGAPADYDEWHALGAHGWNWSACLPYFRKLETDCDFDGALHGKSGPIRIQRAPWARISPFARAVLATLDARGHLRRDDQNGEWQDGTFIGSIAVSAAGERIPTSVCYLDDTVRARPNLTIRTHTLVERVLFDGKLAIGARVVGQDGATQQCREFMMAQHRSPRRLRLDNAVMLVREPDIQATVLLRRVTRLHVGSARLRRLFPVTARAVATFFRMTALGAWADGTAPRLAPVVTNRNARQGTVVRISSTLG